MDERVSISARIVVSILDLGILWCLQGYPDVSAYGALRGWPVADAAFCSCAPK